MTGFDGQPDRPGALASGPAEGPVPPAHPVPTARATPVARILAVLHTPRDPHSAVYLGYRELAQFAVSVGAALTILTPEDFPFLRRIHGRWRPLVYPVVVDRWLRRYGARFDVVVFHSYTGWLATRRRRRPFVAVTAFHGLEPLFYRELVTELKRQGRRPRSPFRLLHGAIVPALCRAASRRSARVLCLNQREAEYLVDERWAHPQAVVVVRHGIAPQFFLQRSYAPRASMLLFVGQWLERKGIADLVAAFTALADRFPWLRLCCAGTLRGADEVRASFPPMVRDRVEVYARVDREALAGLYARADLFVLPSQFEGCSLALLEAMAAALPIVTTPVGAAPDLLAPGESVRFVLPRDPEALACAVAALIEDRDRRARLGRAAQDAARRFTLERMNREWLRVLADAWTAAQFGEAVRV